MRAQHGRDELTPLFALLLLQMGRTRFVLVLSIAVRTTPLDVDSSQLFCLCAVRRLLGCAGNHRYQVGFSGDVKDVAWGSLAFQPYFSFTGSNVGYGFWSHDLVGPSDDYELYTR